MGDSAELISHILVDMSDKSREQLEKSSRVLDQTRRTALETEDVANSTLSELRKQREQINGAARKVEQIDANLTQSNKTLKSLNSNSCCIT